MLLHASSAVLFICSILSKETGLTLIGLFVTYDVVRSSLVGIAALHQNPQILAVFKDA